ncbi:MAG: PilZ domain [Candidatus Hydrogenedentota bacterium]
MIGDRRTSGKEDVRRFPPVDGSVLCSRRLEGFRPMDSGLPSQSVDTHFTKGQRCILLIMDERFLATVLSVKDDQLRVSYPSAHFPIEGMYVLLEFHDEDGYSLYESEVLETPRDHGDGLVLRMPHANRRTSHRRTWRVPADLVAQLKDHVHPKRHEARVTNISAGGMQIETDADLGIGHNIDLDVELPGRGKHRLLGAVAHVMVAEDARNRHLSVAGVRFINPEPETSRAITEYIWKQVHKLHPKAHHPAL